MGRYYLTTESNGHIKTLKVKFSEEQNGWDEYLYIECSEDNDTNQKIATHWRDEVIKAICQASFALYTHMDTSTNPLNTSDFKYYNQPYDQQGFNVKN